MGESGTGGTYSLITANGRREGRLVRHELVFLADEGESLRMETTMFVPSESIANPPLGYGGFLEAIRARSKKNGPLRSRFSATSTPDESARESRFRRTPRATAGEEGETERRDQALRRRGWIAWCCFPSGSSKSSAIAGRSTGLCAT